MHYRSVYFNVPYFFPHTSQIIMNQRHLVIVLQRLLSTIFLLF